MLPTPVFQKPVLKLPSTPPMVKAPLPFQLPVLKLPAIPLLNAVLPFPFQLPMLLLPAEPGSILPQHLTLHTTTGRNNYNLTENRAAPPGTPLTTYRRSWPWDRT